MKLTSRSKSQKLIIGGDMASFRLALSRVILLYNISKCQKDQKTHVPAFSLLSGQSYKIKLFLIYSEMWSNKQDCVVNSEQATNLLILLSVFAKLSFNFNYNFSQRRIFGPPLKSEHIKLGLLCCRELLSVPVGHHPHISSS